MSVGNSSIQTTSYPGRLFRPLVAVAIGLHLFLWLLPLAGPRWIPGFDVWLLRFDGYGAAMQHGPVLYWCLLACWVLILVGLFFYVAAARFALVLLVAVSATLSLTWGVRVLTAYESTLDTLAAVIDGVVLAVAYWSPVRAEFEKQR